MFRVPTEKKHRKLSKSCKVIKRVPSRFFGIRYFLLFEARDSGSKSKMRARFGTESKHARWDVKSNHWDCASKEQQRVPISLAKASNKIIPNAWAISSAALERQENCRPMATQCAIQHFQRRFLKYFSVLLISGLCVLSLPRQTVAGLSFSIDIELDSPSSSKELSSKLLWLLYPSTLFFHKWFEPKLRAKNEVDFDKRQGRDYQADG